MDKKKSTGLLLSILGVLSLVLITAGVTYAFFSYTKEGSTENTITTGTIKFIYDEKASQAGNGITITNALPTTDANGMADEEHKFDFVVSSDTPGTTAITYDITARKYGDSKMANNAVKVYLTSSKTGDTNKTYTLTDSGAGDVASNRTVKTYNDLPNYVNMTGAVAKITSLPEGVQEERLLYTGTVPANSTAAEGATYGYTNNLTLKMWLSGGTGSGSGSSGEADYSPLEYMKTTAGEITLADGTTKVKQYEYITSAQYYDAANAGVKNQFSLMYSADGTDKNDGTASTAITYADYKANLALPVDAASAPEGYSGPYKDATKAAYKQVQIYPLSGQTFKLKVNVYANAAVVNSGSGE